MKRKSEKKGFGDTQPDSARSQGSKRKRSAVHAFLKESDEEGGQEGAGEREANTAKKLRGEWRIEEGWVGGREDEGVGGGMRERLKGVRRKGGRKGRRVKGSQGREGICYKGCHNTIHSKASIDRGGENVLKLFCYS